MPDRLPPLTALRAFEAAARHMSFRDAADELAVTPAALSYQIKNLEAHLGAPLFRRLNRAVELTEAGRMLLPGAQDGFDRLRGAWRATQRLTEDSVLTITAGPGFTAKWLAPRMYRFAEANPDMELRVSASLRVMDFARDEVDVAIRFGLGRDRGLHSEHLLDEWVTPMMVPEMAARVATPADLAALPLIHEDSLGFMDPRPDWAAWLRAAGVNEDAAAHGTRFSQADHAVDMALEGVGVVLGRASLCDRYLASGRLVAPFDLALSTQAHYRFICPEGAEARPAVRRFRDWLMAEIEPTRALAEGRRIVPLD
ncbi:transcriptional regulator GcvA [Roseobacter sp. HKCCA0434]|uniref:transcriptional regulator GcvA n=1 Tax=Roseobacter sp. HKCCA0434 TaxID=3079297 RepID=UPI002905F546|nr:transcriptional regulator GcvA [Roseobacter sp. HKCCA0434]